MPVYLVFRLYGRVYLFVTPLLQCIDPLSRFLATWTFKEMSDNVYIAVHGGAGFHERKYGKEIKHALQR